jgi:hypothetical protein
VRTTDSAHDEKWVVNSTSGSRRSLRRDQASFLHDCSFQDIQFAVLDGHFRRLPNAVRVTAFLRKCPEARPALAADRGRLALQQKTKLDEWFGDFAPMETLQIEFNKKERVSRGELLSTWAIER